MSIGCLWLISEYPTKFLNTRPNIYTELNQLSKYTLDHIYAYTYIINMLNETDSFFRMLANSTRLRCLMLMQAEGELCVCELTHALNLSQPKISRHLAH